MILYILYDVVILISQTDWPLQVAYDWGRSVETSAPYKATKLVAIYGHFDHMYTMHRGPVDNLFFPDSLTGMVHS